MNVAAGRLRHLVTFQSLAVELDSDGQQTEVWADAFAKPLRCEISPLSGRELIAAEALQSKLSTRIVLRYAPGLVASMRAVHRGLIYDIESVVPDPESGFQWISLMCSSGVQDVNSDGEG